MIELRYGPVWMDYRADEQVMQALANWLTVDLGEDGEPELLCFVDRSRERIPTGLLHKVEGWAAAQEIPVEREGWPDPVGVTPPDTIVPGIKLYPVQHGILVSTVQRERGIWEVATGGGKTEVAIGLVLALEKRPTVYTVPSSKSLTEIYKRFLARGFTKYEVGRLSGNHNEIGQPVTIAIIDSLYSGLKRQDAAIVKLLEDAEIFLMDEVHHKATAPSWQRVAMHCKARWRVGMSGTAYKDPRSRTEVAYLHPQDTMLQAFLGPPLACVPATFLQDMGRLARCQFIPFPAKGKWFRDEWDWQKVYERGIMRNEERNQQCALLAANLADMGHRPLISVRRRAHGRLLQYALSELGIPSACSYGGDDVIIPGRLRHHLPQGVDSSPVKVRKDLDLPHRKVYRLQGRRARYETDYVQVCGNSLDVDAWFERGIIEVLIGSTVYDENVNLTFITDIINAAGYKARQNLLQRIGRSLRLHERKTMARIWDPVDKMHKYLAKHSRLRREAAAAEGYPIADHRLPVETWWRLRELLPFVQQEIDMQVKEITVRAGFTLPAGEGKEIHPSVEMRAALDDGEDPDEAAYYLGIRVVSMALREAMSEAYWIDHATRSGYEEALDALSQAVEGADE